MKIKSIVTYLFLIAISVLFMLYLDGPGGSYLLAVLLLAAALSIALCVYTKYSVSAEVSVSEDVLNKNDPAGISVTVHKRGILPTAVLHAEFFSSYHFEPLTPVSAQAVCTGRNGCVFKAEFSARYFGKGKLGLSSFYVSDYLGLCSFRVPVAGSMLSARIYPDVPDVNRKDGFARSLTDAAAFDDSEETSQSAFAIHGTPGYEHRPYVPGDSLKLINWKLSAKRDDLFVRQMEGSVGTEQVFVLDKMGGDRDLEQLAAEALLGLTAQFVRSELPVKLFIRFTDVWEEIAVNNPAELAQLRHSMTDFAFEQGGVNRFPPVPSGSRAVVFSVDAEQGLSSYLDRLTSGGKECSAAAAKITVPSERLWKIERDEAVIRFVG